MATLRARTGIALAQRVIPAGARVDSSDPDVKGREHLFELVGAPDAPVVEQATAAPGEVRNVPAKKAGARKVAAAKKR